MKTLNAAIFAAMLALPTAGAFAQEEAPNVSPETGSANTESGGSTPTAPAGGTATGDTSGSLSSENSLPDTNNGQTGSANTQSNSMKAEGGTAQDAEAADGQVMMDEPREGNHGIDSAQDVDPD